MVGKPPGKAVRFAAGNTGDAARKAVFPSAFEAQG
jgi:hypothetical protein